MSKIKITKEQVLKAWKKMQASRVNKEKSPFEKMLEYYLKTYNKKKV